MLPLPSGFEWIVILVIALLILGPGKLPDVAAAVGKSIREFRKASSDVADAVKVDTTPLPATPAPPQANVLATGAQPNVLQSSAADQTSPTPQTSNEPQVQQPIAPVAPAADAMPPVVTAPEAPQPVPDAAPTDVAPKSDG